MIIGLCGLAGSGKDTAADSLVQQGRFIKIAFADPLKRIARDVYDFSDEQLWGPSEMRNKPDKRYFRGMKQYRYPETPLGSLWIPLSNGRGYTLIDSSDFEEVSKHSWHLAEKPNRNTNYVKGAKEQKLHRFLVREVPDGHVIDHVNGDGLDNRRQNLRVCTEAENRQNEVKRDIESASSPFKGVSWDSSREKWSAKICIGGKTENLGRFEREEDAAVAYDQAARKAFGAFARTNDQLFLTPRYALQTLGTEFGRNCYSETWSALGVRLAKQLDGTGGVHYDAKKGIVVCNCPPSGGVAISDVRFWNEIEAIQKAGGRVIRIRRTGAGLKDKNGALHASEAEQSGIADACFDAVIQNDGTLPELHQKVGEVLTSFLS